MTDDDCNDEDRALIERVMARTAGTRAQRRSGPGGRLGSLLAVPPPSIHSPPATVVCAGCKRDIDPRYGYCGHCARREREMWAAPRRTQAMLDTLPSWPWARRDNAAWRSRVDPLLLRALGGWHGQHNLVICGPTGMGKSSAVLARIHALAAAHVEAAARGEYVPMPRVVWLAEAELAPPPKVKPWEHDAVPRGIAAHVLVLDEVGFHAPQRQLVGQIADARYSAGRVTVVTTGMRPATKVGKPEPGLAETYGDATYRRLAYTGLTEHIVDLHGGGR